MSEPLSAKRFEDFVELYTTNHGAVVARLDRIDATLADHTARLERLERNLDASDRLDKIEVFLAEHFGRDVLARAGL